MERNRLTRDSISKLATNVGQDAIVAEVGDATHTEQRLVDVGALESDALHLLAVLGHE